MEKEKLIWKRPEGRIERFCANEYVSACGTGVCNVPSWGDVPGKPVSNYHYELNGDGPEVGTDGCGQTVDITDVDSSFFIYPNAEPVCRIFGIGGKIYESALSKVPKAWSYNGHLLSNVAPNPTRPNHS